MSVFNDNDEVGSVQLSRQKVMALVYTLERLSSSLVFERDLRREKSLHIDIWISTSVSFVIIRCRLVVIYK